MKVWNKTRRSNTWGRLADRTYDVKRAIGGYGCADPVICKDFVDMVLDGKEPLATPLAGRMSVAAGVCMAQSLRSPTNGNLYYARNGTIIENSLSP